MTTRWGYQGAVRDYSEALAIKSDKLPLFELYLERGKVQRKLEALDGSVADISRCLELQKYNSKPKIMAAAYNELGLSLFQKKMTEESIERFSKAIEIDSENPQYLNNRGQAQVAVGRTALAFIDFNKALTITPDDPTILHNRGSAFLAERRFEEAHADFDLAIAKNPEESGYHFSKGRTFYLEERYPEAEQCFQRCLSLQPDSPQTLYELSLTLNHLKRFEEGIESLNHLIKLVPDHTGAFQTRGIIHQKLDNHSFALEDFEVALAADASNPLITFLKGRSLLELQSFQDAIDCFTRALELSYTELDIYRCFAKAYEALGNLEKALYYLNYGLKREPGNAGFLLERSNLHVKMGTLSAGLDDLQQILLADATNAFINYKLGTVFFQNQDFPHTLEAMKSAFACGDLAVVHQPNAYYVMGLSLASMEQFAEAVECFARAIELNPDKAVYYHERAKCLLMTDQFARAVEDFNQTIERQPANANAHFGRGFAYKNLLDFKKAVG